MNLLEPQPSTSSGFPSSTPHNTFTLDIEKLARNALIPARWVSKLFGGDGCLDEPADRKVGNNSD